MNSIIAIGRQLGYDNITQLQKFRKEYRLLNPHQGTTLSLKCTNESREEFIQGINRLTSTDNQNKEFWWLKPVIDRILKLRGNIPNITKETINLNIHKNNQLEYTVNFDYWLKINDGKSDTIEKSGIIFINTKKSKNQNG